MRTQASAMPATVLLSISAPFQIHKTAPTPTLPHRTSASQVPAQGLRAPAGPEFVILNRRVLREQKCQSFSGSLKPETRSL
jgi:hypothetical protein